MSEPGSDIDKSETDSEHSRYEERCGSEYGALSESRFRSQK